MIFNLNFNLFEYTTKVFKVFSTIAYVKVYHHLIPSHYNGTSTAL